MISLRYHVVTIVAVFLALAVGLLGGGAFVQPALQRQLESQTQQLREANADLRRQIDEVRDELDALGAFAETALPHLTQGRLIGTTSVLVVVDGADGAAVDQAQRALEEAGSDLVAVLSVRSSLVSEDPGTRQELATIVGSDPGAADLPAATATALAGRLGGTATPVEGGPAGEDPASEQAAGDDVLSALLSAGFLDANVSEATLERIGFPGQLVIVVGGGAAETPSIEPASFAVPLVEALAALDAPVAAAESIETVVPFVGEVRGSDGVVTVDDLDRAMGGAALVLGLDRMLLTGAGGDYGVRDGADPLPPA